VGVQETLDDWTSVYPRDLRRESVREEEVGATLVAKAKASPELQLLTEGMSTQKNTSTHL
jgi:hypothetical protein